LGLQPWIHQVQAITHEDELGKKEKAKAEEAKAVHSKPTLHRTTRIPLHLMSLVMNHVEDIKVAANAVEECVVVVLIVSMAFVEIAIITDVVEATDMNLIDVVRCRLDMPPSLA
jgi:hypothetical protein